MLTIQRMNRGGPRIGAGRLSRSLQRRDETREQCDQPVAGHSDSGDNGQGNKPGDEAVFDGGGAGLVVQKLSDHAFPSNCADMLVAPPSCSKYNQKRKIARC